jgi:hypothetical protein
MGFIYMCLNPRKLVLKKGKDGMEQSRIAIKAADMQSRRSVTQLQTLRAIVRFCCRQDAHRTLITEVRFRHGQKHGSSHEHLPRRAPAQKHRQKPPSRQSILHCLS